MSFKRPVFIVIILILVIGTFAAVLIFAGPGGKTDHNTAKTGMKIGVSIYDQYDTFISSLSSDLTDAAKKMEQEKGISITLNFVNSGGSQLTQNYQAETFINQDYDILCINLADRTDASTVIDMAMNADIPIIFFNRELVEKDIDRWDKLYYVGATALESGIMQGQIIIDAWNKDKSLIDKNKDGVLQYVLLEGEAGHQDASIRTEYVIKTITEAGIKVEKLGDEIANWKRDQAETRMSQWIKTYDDTIEAVIANNDDMALGAIDALKKAGIRKLPVVAGIDGTLVGLAAVKNGDMIGTVLNDAEGQAKGILELAYSLAFHQELPEDIKLIDGKYIRLPYTIITPANVNDYMKP